MSKILILMDVDGTIAESSQNISENVAMILKKMSTISKYEFGIVGGSNYTKISSQLDNIHMTHVFSENGCVYHKNGISQFKQNIRNHSLFPQMNLLVKIAMKFLSETDYILTGQMIDLRNGIIYISLIGSQATMAERKYFIELDKKNGYRAELLLILKEKAITMGIADKIDILLGGSVGIGIHPHEWDKIQVLDYIDIPNYKEIYYFGDKFMCDGNDYRLIMDPRVIGQKVNSPDETTKILTEIFSKHS